MAMISCTCPACKASIMLDNSKSSGFCSSCGVRLTLTSGQAPDNKQSREQLLSDYLQMAVSAQKAKNYAQCEMYCNKILETDISNSLAWALKAAAAGWQSTLAGVRVDEMVEYYGNAITYAKSNDEISGIQKAAREDLKYITAALFEKEMGIFEKIPDADSADAIINHYTNALNAAKKLTVKISSPVDHDELFDPSTTYVHNGAVAAHKRARKEYADDTNGYPGEYAFRKYLDSCENILKVYTILVIMYGNDYTNISIVYDNMISIHKLLLDSCSYVHKYIGGGEWKYLADLRLNEPAKARHRKEISDLTAKKAENERKKRAEEGGERQQRVDAYWNNHPAKKRELLWEKNRVSAELKKLEKDLSEIEKDRAVTGLRNEIIRLTVDRQALGPLNILGKKDLDCRISEKEKKLSAMLADRKKTLEEQIAIKKKRIAGINHDLTRDRTQAEIDSADITRPSTPVSKPVVSGVDSTKTTVSDRPSGKTVNPTDAPAPVVAQSTSGGSLSDSIPKASGKVFEEVDKSAFGEHVWHPAGDNRHEFRVYGFEEKMLRKVNIEIRDLFSKRVLHRAGCIVSLNNVSSSYTITTDYVIKDIRLWPGNRISCVLIFNLLSNGKKEKETSCQISTGIFLFDEKESKDEIQRKRLIIPDGTESPTDAPDPVVAQSTSGDSLSDSIPKASGKVSEEVDKSAFGEHVWHPAGDNRHEFRVYGFEEKMLRKVNIEIRDLLSKKVLYRAGCIVSLNNVSSSYTITTDYVIKDIRLWPGNRISCVLIFNLLSNGKKEKETSCQISTGIFLFDEKESKDEIQRKRLIIPDGTESIANKKYMGSDIESVECSPSLKHIDGLAFSNCWNLSEVVLNNGLESIGFAAFSKCPCLKEVSLPDSIRQIHRAAFVVDENHLTGRTESQVCIHLSSALATKLLGEEEKDNFTALYARSFVIDGKKYKDLQTYGQTIKRETPQREESEHKKTDISQKQTDENAKGKGFGENVWHCTPDGRYQFRLYGFVGNNNPIRIQFRESQSLKVTAYK